MTAAEGRKPDMEKARRDPLSVFASPEELRDHPGLDRAEKLELLRRWEYDARELEVAEEEGMVGGEGDVLDRIGAALLAVAGEGAAEQGGHPVSGK